MKRIFRMIISISFFGISCIGVVFLVWPEYQEYSALRAQVQVRETRLENGERRLAELKSVQQEIALHQEDFAKADEAVPRDAGLPVPYEHIQQIAASSGLVLLSIEGEYSKELLDEVDALVFRVELAGSYEGLKNFLDSVQRSARIFNVRTLDVSVENQDSGELKIEIELFAYESPS